MDIEMMMAVKAAARSRLIAKCDIVTVPSSDG